jgi:hypothetical protein
MRTSTKQKQVSVPGRTILYLPPYPNPRPVARSDLSFIVGKQDLREALDSFLPKLLFES